MLDTDLPNARQDRFEDEQYDEDEDTPSPSLVDDILALIEDGRTYADAEVAYQKSRLGFSLKKGRGGAGLTLLAIALIHLALVALVVGSVIALSPILTPMGATLLVTLILLLAAWLSFRMAVRRFKEIAGAFQEGKR